MSFDGPIPRRWVGGRVSDVDLDLASLGDRGLAAAIGEGRRDALAQAYERHGGRVHDLARQLCGPDHADEVVQDVFLGLWHAPGRFDPRRGSLSAYLMVQTRTRAVDLLGGDASWRTSEDAWQLLAQLPTEERDAVLLACLTGRTYHQVAELLGLPTSTVTARIRSGLRRLGTLMATAGPSSRGLRRT